MKKNIYIIKEYQNIVRGESEEFIDSIVDNDNIITMDCESFDLLEKFVLFQNEENEKNCVDDEKKQMESNSVFFRLTSYKGKKTINAVNYVGVIALKNGTKIEILPKIYQTNGLSKEQSQKLTRKILMKMLWALPNFPHKTKADITSLDIQKMPMLELFYRYFIDELFLLVKRGLKSDYDRVTENEPFFKGKLIVSEQMKRNTVHKERFFITYDEFSLNRPENRLIQTTVQLLRNLSTYPTNRRDLQKLQIMLTDIKKSDSIEADLAKVSNQRTGAEYKNVIAWCRLFLNKTTYTTFSGTHSAFAFLFPMEKVFESYVAKKMNLLLPNDYSISTQDTGRTLFDSPKSFYLRPDIVVKKGNQPILIFDTKWKTSDSPTPSDMYQMYVYLKRYPSVKQVFLLYPQTSKNVLQNFGWNDEPERIGPRFFNLENIEKNRDWIDNILKYNFSQLD